MLNAGNSVESNNPSTTFRRTETVVDRKSATTSLGSVRFGGKHSGGRRPRRRTTRRGLESGRDVFRFDATARTTSVISQFIQESPLTINHSTFAFNNGESAVMGNIEIGNSLFAGNVSRHDLGLGVRSVGYNAYKQVYAEGQKSSKDLPAANYVTWIGELSRSNDGSPGYPLVIRDPGAINPLIDAASSESTITSDQWGRPRNRSDIGAFEALTSSIAGEVFADFNGNGIRDNDEPRVAESIAFVDLDNDGKLGRHEAKATSTNDNSTTVSVDETGFFQLKELSEGTKIVRVVPPLGWSVGKADIARVSNGSNQLSEVVQETSIAPDGRSIVVRTKNNSDPNDTDRIYIFDVGSKTLRRIGATSVLVSKARNLSFSGNDAVVFESDDQIYRLQLSTEVAVLLSRTAIGSIGDGYSRNPRSSSDGSFVVFDSIASDLVEENVGSDQQIDTFLWRRSDGSLRKTQSRGRRFAYRRRQRTSFDQQRRSMGDIRIRRRKFGKRGYQRLGRYFSDRFARFTVGNSQLISRNEDGSQELDQAAVRQSVPTVGRSSTIHRVTKAGRVSTLMIASRKTDPSLVSITQFIDRGVNLTTSADGRYVAFAAQIFAASTKPFGLRDKNLCLRSILR